MKKHERVLKQIADWNAAHPEGTDVDLREDSGALLRTKTRSIAWGLGDTDKPHTAVVSVNGKRGGWELARITAVPGGSVPDTPAPVVRESADLPYCHVCGTSELAARPMAPKDGTELVCGAFVYKHGARVGQCVYADSKALERAALLRRAQQLLESYLLVLGGATEVGKAAHEVVSEIDKLPKEVK